MLVQHDSGFKVWGTRPGGSGFNKGDRVRFSATVEAAPGDPKFGFFSRPKNAVLVTAASAVSAAVAEVPFVPQAAAQQFVEVF
jgi:hypothetical protein